MTSAYALVTVKVDPHGDRRISIPVLSEPGPDKSRESEEYKKYLYNKAIHAAIEDRGHVLDERGDYPHLFADAIIGLESGANLKTAKAAFDNTKAGSPLFPFPNTLKVTPGPEPIHR